jgi:hypothetical protein
VQEQSGANTPASDPAGQAQPGGAQPQGGAVTSWRDTLPDDLKGEASLSKFADVPTLAKSYLNAERMIGRDKIPMPQTDEEFRAVALRLGAKEKAADYDIKPTLELPKGMEVGDLTWYKEAAAELGLTVKQAQGVLDKFYGVHSAGVKSAEDRAAEEFAKAETALRNEWGADFDQRVHEANRAIDELGGETLRAELTKVGLINNPVVAKMFANLAAQVLEDTGLPGTGNDGGGDTIASLEEQIKTIQAQQFSMVQKQGMGIGSHPEYKALQAKLDSLFARRYPSKPKAA